MQKKALNCTLGVLATNSNNTDQGRSLSARNSIMGGAARSSYDTWLLECWIFARRKSAGYERSWQEKTMCPQRNISNEYMNETPSFSYPPADNTEASRPLLSSRGGAVQFSELRIFGWYLMVATKLLAGLNGCKLRNIVILLVNTQRWAGLSPYGIQYMSVPCTLQNPQCRISFFCHWKNYKNLSKFGH